MRKNFQQQLSLSIASSQELKPAHNSRDDIDCVIEGLMAIFNCRVLRNEIINKIKTALQLS